MRRIEEVIIRASDDGEYRPQPTRTRWIVLLIIIGLLYALDAKSAASDCYSIRDYDKRQECLAIDRGSESSCYSIREYDQRQICIVKARRGREMGLSRF